MLENILIIISIVLIIPDLWFVLRYNTHMFQQNGYKVKEHWRWYVKNFRRQNVLTVYLIPAICLALINMPFNLEITFVILVLISLVFTLVYYIYLKRENTKKKLVFTNRVKRLIFTNFIVICVVSVLSIAMFTGFKGIFKVFFVLYIALLLFIALIPYILLLSNLINKPIEKGINQYYVNDAKRILKEVDPVVIGVTGSYGKTSVKYFLKTLLEEKYDCLITPESYNTPMGVVKTIRGEMKPSNQIFVCEMGARHVGDIKEICDIVHPKHGIITAVGPQHLETFFTIENIKKTKFELADSLPSDGLLFVNSDSENIVDHVNENKDKYGTAISYHVVMDKDESESKSENNKACTSKCYTAENISFSASGTAFTVKAPDGEIQDFDMSLVGGYNVSDVLGAIAVANSLSIPLHDLVVPVRRLRPVMHRMQLIDKGGKVSIIDDAYNSNPVGSKAAVETLHMFDGLHVLITPGMVELGDKEDEYNKAFGKYAAENCDNVILIGSYHTKPIRDGLLEAGFPEEKIKTFEKLPEAVNFAYMIPTEKHKYILLENDLPDNYS